MSMSKDEQLETAALEGKFEKVKELCADPSVNVNWHNKEGYSAFFNACGRGHAPIVQHLLAYLLVDPNLTCTSGATPFFAACQEGHSSVVSMLLADQRIDVNKPMDDGATPFFMACSRGHSSVVSMLLADQRIDVNQLANDRATPFFQACWKGHSSVVSMLLADKRIDVNKPKNTNSTPLWAASQNGHLSVVQLVLASDRDIDTKTRSTYKNKTAAEQARFAPSYPVDSNTSEEIFQRRKTNCPIIADLIDSYEKDSVGVRSTLRKQLGLKEPIPAATIPKPAIAPRPAAAFLPPPASAISYASIPVAVMTTLEPVKSQQATESFLTVAAIDAGWQEVAQQKEASLAPAVFKEWVSSVGELFEAQLGSDVQAIHITEANKDQVKEMIQELSKSLSSAAAAAASTTQGIDTGDNYVPESQLQVELARNKVTVKEGTYETHRSLAWSNFEKKRQVNTLATIKHSDGALGADDLLALRLYTMDKEQLSTVCYTTVNQGLRDSTSAEWKTRKQGEKIRNEWRLFIAHLMTTVSELKGTTGSHYRGQSYVPGDTGSLKAGDVIVWPAFTSCSTHRGVAAKFAKGKLVYEIKVPSEYGGSVRDYSFYPTEGELVFPPFTSFRVDGVVRNEAQVEWTVRLTCLGITPTPISTHPPVKGGEAKGEEGEVKEVSEAEQKAKKEKIVKGAFEAVGAGNGLYLLFDKGVSGKEAGESKNAQGESLLSVAAKSEGGEVGVKWLVSHGADVNVTNSSDGKTALHSALEVKKGGAAKILLQQGADEKATSKAGKAAGEVNPEMLKQIKQELEAVKKAVKEEGNQAQAVQEGEVEKKIGGPMKKLTLEEENLQLKKEVEELKKELEQSKKKDQERVKEIEQMKKRDQERDKEIEELRKLMSVKKL